MDANRLFLSLFSEKMRKGEIKQNILPTWLTICFYHENLKNR
ncbi:hypothetical protein HMPREF1564_3276 [Providencia alcalifaciens R90-1475]|nr:hypothetical protein HMPREF1564_3276 [Providencia alcalifaciens R90-1475]